MTINSKFSDIKLLGLWFILAILFAFIYSQFTSYPAFTTPDENGNYRFSILYRETGNLYYEEDLNAIAQNTIVPTHAVVCQERVVPLKFIGLPIYYGSLSAISEEVLPYLTPIIAVFGALFLYLLSKELFGRSNGIISLLLVFILPPYWYWSNYPLMENVFGSVFFTLGLVYFFKGLSSFSLCSKKLQWYRYFS